MHSDLHVITTQTYTVDGTNVVPDVWSVLDRIKVFTTAVRDGSTTGCTGKKLTDIVSIGIGGSYLGPEFVHEALRKGEMSYC